MAQVEIAGHPAIALDLLAFKAASQMLDDEHVFDGADVQFRRPRSYAGSQVEDTPAALALAALEKALPSTWRKGKSEAARFEAFRSLPQADKLKLLAYAVALTLQPKLAPGEGDEVTAYDAALAATEGSVAAYWRPGKDSFLGRISRDQLLLIARDIFGEAWAQPFAKEKKAALVEALARAFSDPEQPGRTKQQVEKLRTWLPAGMAFSIAKPTPSKGKKARKAA